MIKKIIFINGNLGTSYILNDFFEKNPSILTQKNMHYKSINSFFRPDFFSTNIYDHYEEYFAWRLQNRDTFSWQDALKPIDLALEEFSTIKEETLIIPCTGIFNQALNQEFFNYLNHVLSNNTPITVDIFAITPERDILVYTQWLQGFLLNRPQSLLNVVTQVLTATQKHTSLEETIQYGHKNFANIFQQIPNNTFILGAFEILESSSENLLPYIVCNVLGIDLASLEVHKPHSIKSTNRSIIFAPEVLSFIMSIHAYLSENGTINWLSQEKFLQYNTNKESPYNYIKPYHIEKLHEKFGFHHPTAKRGKDFLESENFIKRPSAYDAPFIVTQEHALILGELLEKEFRQFLLNKLNRDTLKYQSQSIRNAFAAILKIEKEISDIEYDDLTKKPLGTILTGDEHCQNNPLEEPIVTILTQTYNQEQFIEKQILSVIKQKTTFPVSHVIIDDCSTDGTREILLKYANLYPHITLILREKNKINHAIYTMFDQVTTPYVALCEGDDYFTHRLKLQRQVDMLEKNPDFALTFHAVEFVYLDMEDEDGTKSDGTGWRTRFHPESWPVDKKFIRLAELLKGNLIQTNSVMYRWRYREGIPISFARQMLPGDWYWHILLAEKGKIGFDPICMSAYVRHPKGLFSETVHSIARHRRKRGKAEVHFFETINWHFNQRYQRTMRNGQASVFVTVGQDAMQTKDFSAYVDLCKTYPYLCEEFDINIERLEATAELEAVKQKMENKQDKK